MKVAELIKQLAELIKQLQALPQDDEVLLDWHEIASIHRGHPWPQDTGASSQARNVNRQRQPHPNT